MAAAHNIDERTAMATRCDEAADGSHRFVRHRTIHWYSWVACVLCCPCYVLCSCACSNGAAFANPVMEQMCHGKQDGVRDGPEPICENCDLSVSEAIALERAREAERAGKRTTFPPGHFTTAQPELMIPGAILHDPHQSTRIGHTHYAPQSPPPSHQPGYGPQSAMDASSPRFSHSSPQMAQANYSHHHR